jgi:hypothetical protein
MGGIRHEARIRHEKEIVKIAAELKPIESAISKEQAAEADCDREIAKLALKAAQGDREALTKQRELRKRKEEQHIQAENLEALAVPIRQALATAEAETPHFELAEIHEQMAEYVRKLSVLGAELSKIVKPVARAFGEFRAEINATSAGCLLRIARGDPERIQRLQNQWRTMLVRGIRAQLSFDFRSEGLEIIDVGQFDGRDFESVCEPVFRSMIAALEVDLHANGVPTPGRATFRCATNISGLFGLRLRVGEIVSLPLEDVKVQALIADGALVEDSPDSKEESA